MNADSAKLAQERASAPKVVEGTFEFQGEVYNFKATPKQETKMSDQHRATDSEWHCLKARTCGNKSDAVAYSTIHELLCRIEALENAQHAHVDLSHLSDAEREKILKLLANPGRFEVLEVAQPAEPDSSLKERIKSRMKRMNQSGCATWEVAIESVLAEAVTWMRKESNVYFEVDELELYKAGLYWAQRLEQEAER